MADLFGATETNREHTEQNTSSKKLEQASLVAMKRTTQGPLYEQLARAPVFLVFRKDIKLSHWFTSQDCGFEEK